MLLVICALYFTYPIWWYDKKNNLISEHTLPVSGFPWSNAGRFLLITRIWLAEKKNLSGWDVEESNFAWQGDLI